METPESESAERKLSALYQLKELRVEHRDLDHAIHLLQEAPYIDQLQVKRMKKRKLLLRDTIERLESELIPDLNA
ncbi:YdcH family protein [Pelagibaculum spongiae]|uniref:YdcH family protein n=1 Tax=Pelagibaculum spongiae TaxID=2080658 RepID=UPI0019D45A9F|nr:YdcH family protein [Pelagibaculum spongiae]